MPPRAIIIALYNKYKEDNYFFQKHAAWEEGSSHIYQACPKDKWEFKSQLDL